MLRASMIFINFRRRNYDKATLTQLSDLLFHVSDNTDLVFQPYYFPAVDATMDQRSLPLGYSFLGNEPDPTVCCDLRDCQRQQAVDYKRLNCGHSFHTECLRDTCSDLGQSASNADRARLCPICHPLLEDRIRELSTTMNRLVKKKRF